MSKYIIEIEDEPFGRNDDPNIPHGMDELYKAKGFNSLVFDQFGLDKLTPLDKALSSELGEAYQKGFEAGQHEATTLEYQQGLADAWEAARKIDDMSGNERHVCFGIAGAAFKFTASEAIAKLREYEQQKADEIKVGDIITDGKINYLVIDITDKSYVALQGTDFEPVYIGKDFIKSYHNLHDSKDMRRIAEEISKAMKEGAK